MILRNYTPFSPLFFESRDVRGQEFGVVVVRGTFTIIPFEPLRPDPKQWPIVEADKWHGEINTSSVYMESDLAPFKPRSDIHINAIAQAPGGRPLPEWDVQVNVGSVEKALRVTGPRWWVRERGDWRLTDPEPTTEVPIRYEHAFGGAWTDEWGRTQVFENNPVGTGYVCEDIPRHVDSITAPQIEAPNDPVTDLAKPHEPQGLGPIARAWLPRRKLAGTYDDAWLKHRWPELPEDFDYAHYNSAHPDLIYPGFLLGDEEVRLQGFLSADNIRFYLPGCKIVILLKPARGRIAFVVALLDTVLIDIVEARAHLTWRATYLAKRTFSSLEVRMTSGADRASVRGGRF